jgi:2-ketocyclohexanecarboxyl-CoA hydrolase
VRLDDNEDTGVLYQLDRGVAWITLNRPERLNAIDEAMCRALCEALDRGVEAGVVVLRGAGRAFCAGGYLRTMVTPTDGAVRSLYGQMLQALQAIRRCPRPVIAAVDGPAVGGGNEFVVACDLAIATDRSVFGQTGPRVGSAPVFGGTNLLAISIGEKRAKEVAFLCRQYTAQEALSMGWINAVVGPSDLGQEVDRWVDELWQLSPRYLEIAKSASNVWWNASGESFNGGHSALIQAIGSADMTEGAKAFMERRAPQFREPRV